MSAVVTVLRAVRERLSDPRRWVKYHWSAFRDELGCVHRLEVDDKRRANCWCLGQAITHAAYAHTTSSGSASADTVRVTELRSDVERVLLETLDEFGVVDSAGKAFPAIYLYQDRPEVSHADVIFLLERTLARLTDVTRDPALEALYDRVSALAESDAKAGIAGRQLEGELADLQAEYEEAHLAAAVALSPAEGAN